MSSTIDNARAFYSLLSEYNRICAAIGPMDQLQAFYHRAGMPVERAEIQASLDVLLERQRCLREIL